MCAGEGCMAEGGGCVQVKVAWQRVECAGEEVEWEEHVCMYVCMYMYACMYMCVCMYICMYVCTVYVYGGLTQC